MSLYMDVDSLLYLVKDVVIKFDNEHNLVNYAYYNGKSLGKDIPFDIFMTDLWDLLEVKIKSSQLDSIKYWMISDSKNEYVFSTETNDNKKVTFCFKNTNCEDGKLFLLENLVSKKELYDLVDPLTDVYQKSSCEYLIRTEILKKNSRPFSLFVIDIDNFKFVNDSYGHLVGDQVLAGVAELLKKHFKNAIIGRYGGDEFVVADFDSTDYQDVWNSLHKLALDVPLLSHKYDSSMNITITIGCSRYKIDSTEYEDLFMKADKALYRGKRKGKNCFIIYDDEKHRNINLDGVAKTTTGGRGQSESYFKLLNGLNQILNRDIGYENILKNALDYIGEAFQVDRAVIYYALPDGYEKLHVSYYANKSEEINEHTAPKRLASLWNMHMVDGFNKMNSVKNIDTMNPELYQVLNGLGIHSLMRCDLKFKNTLLGSICLNTYSKREWTLDEQSAYKLLVNMLSLFMYKSDESTYLETKAYIDSLTKLDNYSYFMNKMYEKLNGNINKYVLYSIDLVKFKIINSLFGYRYGNEALKIIAKCLKDTFGNESLISRVPEEKFYVFVKYVSDNKIKEDFDKLLENISSNSTEANKLNNYLIIKCGIYVTDGIENSPSVIIDNANMACNSVLNNTKSSYVLFDLNIKQDYDRQEELVLHFHDALKNDEFLIYLQPKINMETNELIGAEALSRWNYKNKNLLSPNDFIPILEKNNLITELDYYVLEKVCQYIKTLLNNNKKVVPISVNLSKNQYDLS